MDDTPTRFDQVAATLAANGYRPLPIIPGEKSPPMKKWPEFVFAPGDEKKYATYGAGINASETPGADIDVNDSAAAAAIENMVREVLHVGEQVEIPRRTGQAPRVLLPLRCATPFEKIQTAKFRMRSCPEAKASKVEILCDGQQFVAYGIHKETHPPYTWNGGSDLLAVPRDQLPEITEAQAREIVRQSETILEQWGEREPENDKAHGARPGETIAEGGRNETLYKFGCKLAAQGFAPVEIETALLTLNAARCQPPLGDDEVRAVAQSAARHAQPESHESEWPTPINLVALAEHEPQAPRFVLRDWMPAGYATLLAGHGGVGKSAIGLHVAACVALGLPFFGIEPERHRVLYLSCEDRTAVPDWRLHHLCAYRNIKLADLHDSLDVLDLVGRDTVLWDRDPRTGYTITPAFGQLEQRITLSGARVLVVDGVSDTFGGNENARGDVKRYVNALLSLTPEDGALLLIGHVNRPTASGQATSEGYSGSTQWHNAVRARWYLYPEIELDANGKQQRDGRLLLELQKSSLGAVQPTMLFRYDEHARLFLGTHLSPGGLVDSIREGTERRDILRTLLGCEAAGLSVPAAMQGPRTAYVVLSQRPEFPDAMRAGSKLNTKRFARHIETLRQIRHIQESSIRRSNRHLTAVFSLTAEGRAECATL